LAKLDIPVGQVNEMLPTVVRVEAQMDLNERTPFWSFRLANQVHAGLGRGAVALACVALDTGADDVFPNRWSTSVPWNDVIQIQIFPLKSAPTVLAGVLIPLENIMPGKFDLFFGITVKKDKQNDARHPDFEGDCADAFRVWFLLREILPLVEVVSLKRTILGVQDNLSPPFKQKG
jgi:hypothetical protein